MPLPYAASRLAWALGIPVGLSDASRMALEASDATMVEFSLSGMALGGALLTLGLGQRWGEVFPGWLPFLAGKRVPPALAIIPATLASVVLTVGGLTIYRMVIAQGLGDAADWGAVTPGLVFLPWGHRAWSGDAHQPPASARPVSHLRSRLRRSEQARKLERTRGRHAPTWTRVRAGPARG